MPTLRESAGVLLPFEAYLDYWDTSPITSLRFFEDGFEVLFTQTFNEPECPPNCGDPPPGPPYEMQRLLIRYSATCCGDPEELYLSVTSYIRDTRRGRRYWTARSEYALVYDTIDFNWYGIDELYRPSEEIVCFDKSPVDGCPVEPGDVVWDVVISMLNLDAFVNTMVSEAFIIEGSKSDVFWLDPTFEGCSAEPECFPGEEGCPVEVDRPGDPPTITGTRAITAWMPVFRNTFEDEDPVTFGGSCTNNGLSALGPELITWVQVGTVYNSAIAGNIQFIRVEQTSVPFPFDGSVRGRPSYTVLGPEFIDFDLFPGEDPGPIEPRFTTPVQGFLDGSTCEPIVLGCDVNGPGNLNPRDRFIGFATGLRLMFGNVVIFESLHSPGGQPAPPASPPQSCFRITVTATLKASIPINTRRNVNSTPVLFPIGFDMIEVPLYVHEVCSPADLAGASRELVTEVIIQLFEEGFSHVINLALDAVLTSIFGVGGALAAQFLNIDLDYDIQRIS